MDDLLGTHRGRLCSKADMELSQRIGIEISTAQAKQQIELFKETGYRNKAYGENSGIMVEMVDVLARLSLRKDCPNYVLDVLWNRVKGKSDDRD